MFINEKTGYLQDWITQLWVKLTGKRLSPEKDCWLVSPTGDTRLIKNKFIEDLAAKENLAIKEDITGAGLLESFDVLGLTLREKELLNPRVADFYEHTSNYHFEIWSEWCGLFKPFGWLLSVIFSRRLQQLNLPLNSIESAKGIQSTNEDDEKILRADHILKFHGATFLKLHYKMTGKYVASVQ